jgi:hypothetical protein
VNLFVLDTQGKLPVVDVLSGSKQIFQSSLPNIQPFLSLSPSSVKAYLVPHDSRTWTREYLKYVRSAAEDKPTIYFNRSDNPTKHRIPNTISLQHTIPTDFKPYNCILIPYNVQSLEFLNFRTFGKPIISFVGYTPRISPRRIMRAFFQSPLHPLKSNGSLVRKFGVLNLSRMSDSILVSRPYYGGAISQISNPTSHRREFVTSMAESDFVFAPRGDANGSQRFFEALSCGRIPVVPKTNIFLPKFLKHSELLHFLEIKTLSSNLQFKLGSFWTTLDSSLYTQIQVENRKVFRNSLNFSTYMLSLLAVESVEELQPLVFNDETLATK